MLAGEEKVREGLDPTSYARSGFLEVFTQGSGKEELISGEDKMTDSIQFCKSLV